MEAVSVEVEFEDISNCATPKNQFGLSWRRSVHFSSKLHSFDFPASSRQQWTCRQVCEQSEHWQPVTMKVRNDITNRDGMRLHERKVGFSKYSPC
jgi:hypothetical protein